MPRLQNWEHCFDLIRVEYPPPPQQNMFVTDASSSYFFLSSRCSCPRMQVMEASDMPDHTPISLFWLTLQQLCIYLLMLKKKH